MTILFLLSTLDRTGPVNLTYDVIRYLPKNEYKVLILTLSPEKATTRKPDFEALENTTVYSLNHGHRQNLRYIGKSLKEFCVQHRPDIVHSQGLRSDILSVMYLQDYKRVYNIQNYAYDDYVMLYGVKGYLMAFAHLWYLRKQHTLVACSHYIASKISRFVNTSAEVVQNGTESGYEPIDAEMYQRLKKQFSIKDGDKVFVMAVALIERKNPLLVINAFRELDREDLVLIILGDGPLMQSCKSSVGNKARVFLTGHVKNVSPYMQICNYYVSASLSEGLPTAALEALNHGLPTLLSDIPQHSEILQNFSDAGVLFRSDDLTDLKGKILDLIERPYEIMRREAKRTIKEQFNAKRMSEGFQRIYKQITAMQPKV